MSESFSIFSGKISLKEDWRDKDHMTVIVDCPNHYLHGKKYNLGGYSEILIENTGIKDGDIVEFGIGDYTNEVRWTDLKCPSCYRSPLHVGNYTYGIKDYLSREQIYFEEERKEENKDLLPKHLALKCMDRYAKQEMRKILKEALDNLERHFYPGEEWYYKSKPNLYRNIVLATEIKTT